MLGVLTTVWQKWSENNETSPQIEIYFDLKKGQKRKKVRGLQKERNILLTVKKSFIWSQKKPVWSAIRNSIRISFTFLWLYQT